MDLTRALKRLRRSLGSDAVLSRPEDVMLYEYDAGLSTGTPGAVVFPRTTEQVREVVLAANEVGVALIPRGAGTGLSGGSIARDGGIVVAFTRMNRILALDAENERAVVQPGVVNVDLSAAAAPFGLYFAPDPSSQKAATIGGHVAENSGGPHTLACGVTVNHVTALEVVLADGRVVRLGSRVGDACGYDLAGYFVGSEGTLGLVTEITVKLMRLPEWVATLLCIFNSVDDAAQAVVSIGAAGMTPAALEMLDGWTLRTVEEFAHANYPLDSGAVLLVELEGLREQVEEDARAVRELCLRHRAREVRVAATNEERDLLWKGRKMAFAAIGRISPSYYTQDGVVPRSRIPETLRRIAEISDRFGLTIANIFHAGDGNMHPAILFDLRDGGQTRRAHEAGAAIAALCCEMGGSITGEHGVGMEKNELMPLQFNAADLSVMATLRRAFDAHGRMNPLKVLPVPRSCREGTAPAPEVRA